jgi:hypothetical protein
LNLKDKGNPGLRNEIVIGHMSAERVASMSKDVSGLNPHLRHDRNGAVCSRDVTWTDNHGLC